MATGANNPFANLPNFGDPSQTQAALTRMAFGDYITNILPYQNQLFEFAMDQEQPGLAMAKAKEQVEGQFTNQAADLERQLRPQGPLAPDEQRAADRTLALAKAAASAGAQNRARDQTRDRQMAILGGGIL